MRRGIEAGVMALEHQALLLSGWIADANLHEEAIELRLRQRIGAFEIDRVLRREDGEDFRQRTAFACPW